MTSVIIGRIHLTLVPLIRKIEKPRPRTNIEVERSLCLAMINENKTRAAIG